MEHIKRALLILLVLAPTSFVIAQTTQQALQAIQNVPPIPAIDAPESGLFYTFQSGGTWPPFPGDAMDLPFWDLCEIHS